MYGDPSQPGTPTGELRKPKSSLSLFKKLRNSKSRTRLRSGDSDRAYSIASSTDEPLLPSGSDDVLAPMSVVGMGGPSSPNALALGMKVRRRKQSNMPPPLPPKERGPFEPQLNLDTNIDDMEGIVDLRTSNGAGAEYAPSSPTSAEGHSSTWSHMHNHYNSSGTSFNPKTPPAEAFFSDPFHPSTLTQTKTIKVPNGTPSPALLNDKVSPRTVVGDASWAAPDSWGIMPEEGEDANEAVYSSSDDEIVSKPTTSTTQSSHPHGDAAAKRKSRRKTTVKASKPSSSGPPFNIRIYRSNNTYHVASIKPTVTVAELTPVLNQKLLTESDRETHKLYLKERGRGTSTVSSCRSLYANEHFVERMLAQTEKPADITRRRLEQAGYTPADHLETLAQEDMSFLFKFIYKSQLLGTAVRPANHNRFPYIDIPFRNKS